MSTTFPSTTSFRPGVFAYTMLEPPAGHKKKRIVQSVVSLVVHTSLLALLVILPLLISNTISLQQLNRTFLVAPPPPAPPPKAMVVHAEPAAQKFAAISAKIAVPTVIPKRTATDAASMAAAPEMMSTAGVIGGVGSVLGGEGVGVPPPPPVAASTAPKKPLLITNDMKQPVLIYAPKPAYPPIAQAARIQGTVVVDATINEHGDVVEAHVVSGPGLLRPSALIAVSQQKYQPTILDGQPTPVELHVEIYFHLSTT
jgi:periplasmic protein TonB